ncbi:MAG: 3-hydroxyacyl-CoA dehydrogenase/enoyl-CoA hydratase family protein [Halobacteriota archaeon]
MPLEEIDKVAVIGAGTMGHGIAEVAAIAGYRVSMRDVDDAVVEEGLDAIGWSLEKLEERGRLEEPPADVLDRIDGTTDLETAATGADVVIEAAPESLDLKREIFVELEAYTEETAILATNTSSLPITDIAEATAHPERVVGLHFFNPPVKMDLVEVVRGEATAAAVADRAAAFVESIGKTPIHVHKDVRGFVVNTVLGPYIEEPAWMVSGGEASIRQADAAMVHERGYPMGPFELNDLTGIDVGVAIREEAGLEIPPIMAEKAEAGHVGRKAGRGYYEYEDGPGADYTPEDAAGFDTLRVEARMVNRAAYLVGEDVATPEAIDTGVRLGLGFPEGICRRGDRLGLDAVLEKLRELHGATGEERFEPHPYLVELVEAGRTGETAGAGFFTYDGGGGLGDYHTIDAAVEDGVLSVEVNRPERLNALSAEVLAELDDVFSSVDPDDVRCAVISGAGDRAFSAGADISGFGELEPTDAMDVTPAFETINDFPRPVVARIDGYCLGAGLELALACDLRLATERSTFGSPEINLGLIPGGGGTQRLLRILGETRAKELVFRGNHIDAERAERWGLVNRAVPVDEFEEVVASFVDDLRGGPPLGLEVAKRVLNEGADASLDAALALESQGFGLLMGTEDVREGTAAFAEDREPSFEGR